GLTPHSKTPGLRLTPRHRGAHASPLAPAPGGAMTADPAFASPEPNATADLVDLVLRLGQPRVLVLGDLMLDRYVWGDAERISQEAPVILLHADKREERLGGASSVATMLRALGAKVSLVGVVGADFDGARIRQ